MGKIFALVNGGSDNFLNIAAVAEDGEVLAGHVSSSVSWAKHDIGVNSDWKHELYDAKYPDGWEIEWVDDIENHEGVQKALTLNRCSDVNE